jgi:hypothetical protein
VLVPFRQQLVSENVALVFVVVVVVAAASGGRVAGAVAAVISTLSYDFFFTRPYQSLKIDRAEDVGTVLLLLGIGLVVAEIVAIAQRSRWASMRMRDDVARVSRIAELTASGADAEDVLLSVQAELLGLLSLRDCRFEEPPFDSTLPRLERNGSIEGGRRRWIRGQFTLPAEGLEIVVVGRGRLFGRFVLIPDWDVGVTLDERAVAVALTDHVGAALSAEPWPHRREAHGQ